MIDKIRYALTRRVHETLESGLSIAVIGWRDSNHSQFTRQLLDKKLDKKIVFFSASPDILPERVGLVLMTRFIDHTVFQRIKNTKSIHPIPIGIGQIKRILESCSDLLVPALRSPSVREVSEGTALGQAAEATLAVQDYSYEVLDFLTTPTRRHEMNEMDRFIEAFQKAADKEGFVGKKIVGRIRKENSIEEDAKVLVSAGWIVPGIRPYKKQISYYRAGPKMLATAHDLKEKLIPENPYELAKYLVAQKPAVEAELEKFKMKLARIETAEKVLAQLDDLKESQE